jgi:NitT/TauT family transport system ATP-binding protein
MNRSLFTFKTVSYSSRSNDGFEKIIIHQLNAEVSSDQDFAPISILTHNGASRTLAQLMSGIIRPDSGEIITHNDNSTHCPYVAAQSYLPWLNVEQNILFAFRAQAKTGEKQRNKLVEILGQTGLDGYENHIIGSKSPGFQLRVGLARAAVLSPSITILDDVFNGMNQKLRDEMIQLTHELAVLRKINFILLTPDVQAAELFSNRLYILSKKDKSYLLPK